MAVAEEQKNKSKDPKFHVGACVVDADGKILGVGYNEMPKGCEGKLPWTKKKAYDDLDDKLLYVCHAELNAIVNSGQANLKNAKIYSTLYPCNECAKLIIQSGISEVIYLSNEKSEKIAFQASTRMFKVAYIKTRQHSK